MLRPHRPLFWHLWAVWQRPGTAVPSRRASRSTRHALLRPHRPLFRLLWALWQRPGVVVPSRSTSSSTRPALLRPHRPLFRLLWALWQYRGHCHSWGGTFPQATRRRQKRFRSEPLSKHCAHSGSCLQFVGSQSVMPRCPICVHVRMAEKPPKGSVPRYPNIALFRVFVRNTLVHRALCQNGRSASMLGWLKNHQNWPFRTILTLRSFGSLSAIHWSTGHYVKTADLHPC